MPFVSLLLLRGGWGREESQLQTAGESKAVPLPKGPTPAPPGSAGLPRERL
ncbi:unnamed protein product [Gulo gulo]|uniref:Uncharacterized protein n=1 Tax=Gulo gulo TaxID=48420 RepID=A0A9X9ME50_GULGU|nr:unnamed protein product [Gulo gulo]